MLDVDERLVVDDQTAGRRVECGDAVARERIDAYRPRLRRSELEPLIEHDLASRPRRMDVEQKCRLGRDVVVQTNAIAKPHAAAARLLRIRTHARKPPTRSGGRNV